MSQSSEITQLLQIMPTVQSLIKHYWWAPLFIPEIFDASKIADFELAKISKLCKYFRLSIVKIVFMIVNNDNRDKVFLNMRH